MMRINLTSDQFSSITSICDKYEKEVSGILSLKKSDLGYDVVDIAFDGKELVCHSNSTSLYLNRDKYLEMMAYGIHNSQIGLFVRFHSHIYSSSSRLSMADFNMLKQNQEMAIDIATIKGTKPVIVSEATVTPHEIGFFYFDPEERECKRIPVYVDGEEKKYISERLIGPSSVNIKFGTFGFTKTKNK